MDPRLRGDDASRELIIRKRYQSTTSAILLSTGLTIITLSPCTKKVCVFTWGTFVETSVGKGWTVTVEGTVDPTVTSTSAGAFSTFGALSTISLIICRCSAVMLIVRAVAGGAFSGATPSAFAALINSGKILTATGVFAAASASSINPTIINGLRYLCIANLRSMA